MSDTQVLHYINLDAIKPKTRHPLSQTHIRCWNLNDFYGCNIHRLIWEQFYTRTADLLEIAAGLSEDDALKRRHQSFLYYLSVFQLPRSFFYTLILQTKPFSETLLFSELHFGAVKYISGSRKMSAVWCFFDLSEAMCQLCKAKVSGTAESRRERKEMWSAFALNKKKQNKSKRAPLVYAEEGN